MHQATLTSNYEKELQDLAHTVGFCRLTSVSSWRLGSVVLVGSAAPILIPS